MGWAEQQRVKRKNEGNAAFGLSAESRIDAPAAMEMIAPYRISLRECADFYVRHAATATGDKTIQQIVDELPAVKKSASMSARYLKDLRIRLNIFCATFGKERAVNVSQKMVDDWLIALPILAPQRTTIGACQVCSSVSRLTEVRYPDPHLEAEQGERQAWQTGDSDR